MDRKTSHPNKDTAPADENRRRFLMRAGIRCRRVDRWPVSERYRKCRSRSALRAGTVERRPTVHGPVTRWVLAEWHPSRRICVNAV